MLCIRNVIKRFDGFSALDDVTTDIPNGIIYGLIGSNGSGKSTLLRIMAGIYQPDSGQVTLDAAPIYENAERKSRCFYISDDQFSIRESSMRDMARFYEHMYTAYDSAFMERVATLFELDVARPLKTFSKGMRRQAHIILALASRPDYLFCDETFDGLDPVKRLGIKRLFADEVASRNMTVIIASHNLREIEDICDHVGLLHAGKLVTERSINDQSMDVFKVQTAFATIKNREDFKALDLLSFERHGRMQMMIVRGRHEDIMAHLDAMQPLYAESLPLTLEELFITEMEVHGYDVKELIL